MPSAEELSPSNSSRHGEVDTSLPYEHVSDAVSLFSARFENSSPKLVKSAEKRESLRERLNHAEAARAKAEADRQVIEKELAGLKSSYNELTKRVSEGKEEHVKTAHDHVVAKLDSAKTTLERLQEEEAAGDQSKVEKEQELKAELEKLSKELQEGESARSKLSEEISALVAELEKAKSELAELKTAEQAAIAKVQSTTGEVDQAKLRIKETEDERAALVATTEYLRGELQSAKEELSKTGEASIEEKLRHKIQTTRASTEKLEEARSKFIAAFEHVFAEALEAQVVTRASQEWGDQVRAQKQAAVARVLEAEKMVAEKVAEAGKARAVEASALSAAVATGAEEGVIRKLAEMEEEMRRQIAAVLADMETVKSSEAALTVQLEAARLEAEGAKVAAAAAADRATAAESAKAAVEDRLRKLRAEGEQRRRAAAMSASQRQAVPEQRQEAATVSAAEEQRRSSAESLAHMLNIKVPAENVAFPAAAVAAPPVEVAVVVKKQKKKRLLARLGSIFLLRRS